ncbi:MAG TPA: sigma-54-dependent Fis family transcriptional regulator, partial [Terriglobia bacterium]|nr:sigma-54-dependent Fis family transcriptional regulator [Terriglobia bacterium]
DDLEALAAVLLEELCEKHHQALKALDQEVLQLMRAYRWPGNVRELRNILERAVVTCPGEMITADKLPPGLMRADRGLTAAAGVTK